MIQLKYLDNEMQFSLLPDMQKAVKWLHVCVMAYIDKYISEDNKIILFIFSALIFLTNVVPALNVNMHINVRYIA